MQQIIKSLTGQLEAITKFISEILTIEPIHYNNMKTVLVPVKARRLSKQKKTRPQPYI